MYHKIIFVLTFFLFFQSCSKQEVKYEPKAKVDAYLIYQEAYDEFEKGNYFYAEKKIFRGRIKF